MPDVQFLQIRSTRDSDGGKKREDSVQVIIGTTGNTGPKVMQNKVGLNTTIQKGKTNHKSTRH